VKEHLGSIEGNPAYKRLILTHHKNLNKGDFIIDDRIHRGVDKFEGKHIHFGTAEFPDWKSVVEYLKQFASGEKAASEIQRLYGE
jgi:hypothetical protein